MCVLYEGVRARARRRDRGHAAVGVDARRDGRCADAVDVFVFVVFVVFVVARAVGDVAKGARDVSRDAGATTASSRRAIDRHR